MGFPRTLSLRLLLLFGWMTLAQPASLSGTALSSPKPPSGPLLSHKDMGSSGTLVGRKGACP